MGFVKNFDRTLIIILLLISLLGGGAFFWLYNKQKNLERLIPAFCSENQGELKKTEQIVETVVRKTSQWGALQPKIKDAIVQIFSQIAEFNWLQPYQTPGQSIATGTGFFIDDQSHFITNAHVVNQAKAITIQIPSLGKEQFEAEVVGICYYRDLALLKLKADDFARVKESLGKINYLQIGNSDAVHRAEEVMYQGFPLGQQGLKSTVGVVSGRENMLGRQYIQIDAATNPGCSGGPALNLNGEVVGVLNSGIPVAQNVGYIIPANELKVVLKDLYHSSDPLVRRPFLGVFYTASSPELATFLKNPVDGGVYVVDVFKDSVLEMAGILPGDMIYEINGYRIDTYGEISVPWAEDRIALTEYTSYLTIGHDVNLVVYRQGQPRLMNFKFVQSKMLPIRVMYPDYEVIDYEIIGGFVVMELTLNHVILLEKMVDDLVRFKNPKNQSKSRLIITHIFPASAAQRSRVFHPGNIIKEVNQEKVFTLEDFRRALRKGAKNEALTIRTSQGIFAALSMNRILKQEPNLSAIYRYQITPTVQELIKSHASQKLLVSNADNIAVNSEVAEVG